MDETEGSSVHSIFSIVGDRNENKGLMHICSLFHVSSCCGLLVFVAVLALVTVCVMCMHCVHTCIQLVDGF